MSGGGALGCRVVHCGECEQIASRAAVSEEPGRAQGGEEGGVVLGDVRGGVAGDVREESAASEIRDEGLIIIDDEHNSEDLAGGMFRFESVS